MSTHIFQSLEKLLFEQDTVVLPGFGGFTTTKTPATVDYAQGNLLPPSRAIAFNENLTINDGLLVQMLCRDYGMTNDQASHDVQDFVDKTTSALEQREIITLPGVGRLYKNYAQKVQFLPDNANFNTESYGLPPLQFSPIMRSREVKEQMVSATNGQDSNAIPQASAASNATVLEQPVAKTASFEQTAPPVVDWQPEEAGFFSKYLPWMVGIAAVALAIGIWYTQKTSPTNVKVAKNDGANTEIIIGGDEILPNTKATAPSKPIAKNAEEKGDSRKNDDDADEVREFQKKKQATIAEKPAKVAEKPAEKTVVAPAAPIEKATGDARRAVIIVGTWADKKTAENMITLLEKNGWNSYFRKDGGWQVGIETTYKDFAELKNHLVSLEKLTKQDNIWIKKK